jgi:hypothetical protein
MASIIPDSVQKLLASFAESNGGTSGQPYLLLGGKGVLVPRCFFFSFLATFSRS